jgi:uncharacterized protein YpuA (DUF1002 family)
MFTRIIKKAAVAPVLAVFAGSLAAVPSVSGADLPGPTAVVVATPDYSEGQASELLEQIRFTAVQLSRDSDQLHSMAKSNVSSRSYADSLTRIKDHINQAGKQLAQFERMRSEAAPWQREAIDRITPIAQELAANTEAAINHLNEAPSFLYSPAYKDRLFAITDGAEQMKDHMSAFLDLAKAQQRVDDLQTRIQTSAS